MFHTGLLCIYFVYLTHWGRVTHICVSKLTTIGSYNGLLPSRRQAIIWTNARILLIRTLGTKFSEILSEIHAFSFKKIHLKMSSGKWRPFCLGLNVLRMKWQYSPMSSWWYCKTYKAFVSDPHCYLHKAAVTTLHHCQMIEWTILCKNVMLFLPQYVRFMYISCV